MRLPRAGLEVALSFLLVVLSAEGVARLVGLRLSRSSGWNDPGLGVQAANMRQFRQDHGVVDVAVLGSSTAGEGIDPDRLVRASQAYDSAYNAWHAGAPARSLDLLARALVLPVLGPEVVVIGVTSEQLNDNGSGHIAHDALESSTSRPRVPGEETAAEKAGRLVTEWSYFVRLRDTLRRPNELLEALMAGPDDNPYQIGPRGMSTANLDQGLRLTPRHLEQNRQALADFEVGSVELPALGELVRRLSGSGVKVLIVNLPVLEDVYVPLHPRGSADQERYETALEAFTREEGVAYLDTTKEPWGPEWFADENHVNGRGSARLTDMVAAEVDRLAPASAAGAPG